MIQKTPWIERKFNFDFPVTHFPFILERLKATVPHAESIINNMTDEKLSYKITDKWSIKENIGHLIDLEELHEKGLGEFLERRDKLSPADMSNQKTNLAHHNEKSIIVLQDELKKTRNNLTTRLEKLDEEQLSYVAFHPRLQQQMRLVDMLFFVAEHDLHHLTTIRELKSI